MKPFYRMLCLDWFKHNAYTYGITTPHGILSQSECSTVRLSVFFLYTRTRNMNTCASFIDVIYVFFISAKRRFLFS